MRHLEVEEKVLDDATAYHVRTRGTIHCHGRYGRLVKVLVSFDLQLHLHRILKW
jgi:hypothetical protein